MYPLKTDPVALEKSFEHMDERRLDDGRKVIFVAYTEQSLVYASMQVCYIHNQSTDSTDGSIFLHVG